MDTRQVEGTFARAKEFQGRYESLLEVCDKNGSMIYQDRILEKDQDIHPYKFFRRGTREYVFPPQEVTLKEDRSRIIDKHRDYGIKTEEQTFNFDGLVVKGRIRIEYKDSGSYPILTVTDLLGDSELPEEVNQTLDTVLRGIIVNDRLIF
ncbi:MAG TPA: hypothetical protein VJC39_02240 [Candidatus Nanoarchaeia archaeon]|nr:hypothetical protein [Candidatus Nanoarchaeia archaeon]